MGPHEHPIAEITTGIRKFGARSNCARTILNILEVPAKLTSQEIE